MAKDSQVEQNHIILEYSCDWIAIRIMTKKIYGTAGISQVFSDLGALCMLGTCFSLSQSLS